MVDTGESLATSIPTEKKDLGQVSTERPPQIIEVDSIPQMKIDEDSEPKYDVLEQSIMIGRMENIAEFVKIKMADGILYFTESELQILIEIERSLTKMTKPYYVIKKVDSETLLYLSRETAELLLQSSELQNIQGLNSKFKKHLEVIASVGKVETIEDDDVLTGNIWPAEIRLPTNEKISGEQFRSFCCNLAVEASTQDRDDHFERIKIHERQHAAQTQIDQGQMFLVNKIFLGYKIFLYAQDEGTSSEEWERVKQLDAEMDTLKVLFEADAFIHELFKSIVSPTSIEGFSDLQLKCRIADLLANFVGYTKRPPILGDIESMSSKQSKISFQEHQIACLLLLFNNDEINSENILPEEIKGLSDEQTLGKIVQKVLEVLQDPTQWASELVKSNLQEQLLQLQRQQYGKILKLFRIMADEKHEFFSRFLGDKKEEIVQQLGNHLYVNSPKNNQSVRE